MSMQENPVFVEPKRGPGRPRKDGRPTGEPREESLKERFDRLVEQAHAVQPVGRSLVQFGKILNDLRDIYVSLYFSTFKNDRKNRIPKNTTKSKALSLRFDGVKPFAVWASEEFSLTVGTVRTYMHWGRNPDTYKKANTKRNEKERKNPRIKLRTGSRALDIAKAAFEKLSTDQKHEFYGWIAERLAN